MHNRGRSNPGVQRAADAGHLALGAAIRQEQLSDTALTAFAAILGAVVGSVLGRDTERKSMTTGFMTTTRTSRHTTCKT